MSAKTFRRKDLKHDEFITVAGRASQWLMQRRRRIGWVLLGLALVFSVFASVRFYQQQQERRAAALLAAAMEVYRAPVVAPATELPAIPDASPPADPEAADPGTDASSSTVDPAAPPATSDPASEPTTPSAAGEEGTMPPTEAEAVPVAQQEPPATQAVPPAGLQFATTTEKYEAARERFRPIVERYGGRPSGRVAAFYLGICEAELGDTAAAVEALSHSAEASEPLIAAMALFRLGQLELDLGDPEGAARRFDRLLDAGSTLFPREEALMAKARAQRATGDLRAALATYQRVVDDFAGSFSAVDARNKVEELSAELGLDPDIEGD